MTENTFDTIIIGGGPGGLSAGIYAKRAALNVLLIEKGVLGGQIVNSDEVENYLGFEQIGGAELSMKFGQHAQAYDLDIVSREVAEAMAEGCRRRTGATHAVSATGIAGPGGGSAEKPVGTVFIGLASEGHDVEAKRLCLPVDRETFKAVVARTALDRLRRRLLGL